jgi:hypothetical protein
LEVISALLIEVESNQPSSVRGNNATTAGDVPQWGRARSARHHSSLTRLSTMAEALMSRTLEMIWLVVCHTEVLGAIQHENK